MLSRTIYGAPTALAVGLGAMLIASLVGVLVGGIAGYLGGFIDKALMRGTEFFLVMPVFVVILAVVRLFGIIVVGNTAGEHSQLQPDDHHPAARPVLLAPIARMTRAEFLRLSTQSSSRRHAASAPRRARSCSATSCPTRCRPDRAGGAGHRRRHPGRGDGELPGLRRSGVDLLGAILYFNYQSLKVAPWACLAPGTAIFVTVLGFNLLADGLTDAFNPRVSA